MRQRFLEKKCLAIQHLPGFGNTDSKMIDWSIREERGITVLVSVDKSLNLVSSSSNRILSKRVM